METPLYNKLIEYHNENRISYAMPGHKGKIEKNLIECDVTELSKTADLHVESDEVTKANSLLSKLYNSDRSFILSSGSTSAIQAMIASCLSPGQTLLASSDCHMSVINACMIMGINLRICDKEFDSQFLIPSRKINIKKYLDKFPDIKAVLITSPNYYGLCADIKSIARDCHEHNIPLLVDEAHGAHFIASDKFPDSSSLYADLVCHSAHKTLNALTGAAYLHIKGGLVSHKRVRQCINIFESSSPSYPIAASADIARYELKVSKDKWNDTIKMCIEFSKKLKDLGLKVLDNDDKTRLVINFNGFGISGYDADKLLSDNGIDIEMSDCKNIVLIVTPKNTEKEFDRLLSVIKKIISGSKRDEAPLSVPKFEHTDIICPQMAFFKKSRYIHLKNSIGRISKTTVTAYPPGTPIIITGERITKEQTEHILNLIEKGAKITGLNNEEIEITAE